MIIYIIQDDNQNKKKSLNKDLVFITFSLVNFQLKDFFDI